MSNELSDFANLLVDKMLLSIAEREITETYLSFQQSPEILKFIYQNMNNNEVFNSQNISSNNNSNNNSNSSNGNNGKEDMQYRIPTTSEFMKNLLPDKLVKQEDSDSKADNNIDTFNKEPSLDIILSQSNTPNLPNANLNNSNNGKNPMANLINNSSGNESIYVKCDICTRDIVSNRFAQHLERCLNGKTR